MKLYIKKFSFATTNPYYLASRLGFTSSAKGEFKPPFKLIDSERPESISIDYLNIIKLADLL